MKLPVGNTTICGQSLQSLKTVPGGVDALTVGAACANEGSTLLSRVASDKQYNGFKVGIVGTFTY